jgi:Hint domain
MATTFTWIDSNGDWNTAAAWDKGTIPGILDTAVINQPDSNIVTIATGESIAVAELIIGDPSDTIQVDGTLSVSSQSGATPPISNAGTIILGSGAMLDLGGYVTPSSLGTMLNGGATTQIDGTFDGQGGTFTLGNGEALNIVQLDGQIRNATINTNSAFSIIPGNASLQDDIINGPVGVTSDNTQLTIYQGTTFADAAGVQPGSLSVIGQSDTLVFSNESTATPADGQTLDNVTITIGNATTADSIQPDFNGGTFTIGGNAQIISNDAGALASLDVGAGTTVILDGTLSATGAGGRFTISGNSTFDNNGLIVAGNGDTLNATAVIDGGNGTIDVGTGGVADFTAAVSAGQTLAFTDDTGTLRLHQPADFAATMTGFTIGDTIDLAGVAADGASWLAGQLTISNAGSTVATLSLPGDYSAAIFDVSSDNNGGSAVTAVSCYAEGTRIRTTSGEVAVEHLRAGTFVQTVSGQTQRVRWIGHRHVDLRRHPDRQRALPIRIAAHAFGVGKPARALVLSPDHAVFVDDVLIPIRHLVNGSTVARIECDAITYYHVELPKHDVLLAEGLPAESYLETGARGAFANCDGVVQLHPDFAPPSDHVAWLWETEGYAPLIVVGEQLERVRQKLARRAHMLRTKQPADLAA